MVSFFWCHEQVTGQKCVKKLGRFLGNGVLRKITFEVYWPLVAIEFSFVRANVYCVYFELNCTPTVLVLNVPTLADFLALLECNGVQFVGIHYGCARCGVSNLVIKYRSLTASFFETGTIQNKELKKISYLSSVLI